MRKFLGWLAIAFALFYLVSQPHEAAVAVRDAAGGIGSAFDSFVRFISALVA